ncbi:MAG: efflux RND transporter permease subunit [Halofilum sp. (in: g-proteobacteria)]
MFRFLVNGFNRAVLGHPIITVSVVILLLLGAVHQSRHFELDASAESLMLEDDRDFETYREIRQQYGSDAFLFVTFTPQGPLFERSTLDTLDALRVDLAAVEGVSSVMSMLDVPLVQGPDVNFDTLQEGPPTLRDPDVSLEQAREEFLTSPLYSDLLLNDAADTTAMLVNLAPNERHQELLQRQSDLRERRAAGELDAAGRQELRTVSSEVEAVAEEAQAQLERQVAEIRGLLDQYRDGAEIHLGGVPMIAVDMIDFVRNDITTFGVGVALFIVLLLALAFRRLRWVLVPSMICATTVIAMIGWIGFMRWPVTVVSSNFISLVLIISLSLIVHLIVRYRELQSHGEITGQRELVQETVRTKFKASFFTALTTGISFASLMFANIQPVKDFGLMMVCSVIAGFVFTFILFPALLAPFKPVRAWHPASDWAGAVNRGIAHVVHRHPGRTSVAFMVIVALGVIGASRLTVENRFIDYFHDDTEIYQGMVKIDRELGGTTPLDVVIEAPQDFIEDYEEQQAFDEEMGVATDSTPANGYWYNATMLERMVEIHEYLESFEATGKVLSLGTAWQMVLQINDGEPLEPYELGILYNRVPQELRAQLLDPYMTEDGNEIRFGIRVIDSLPGLNRDELLREMRAGLSENFDVIEPEQVQLSGMLVLYNNVMQSLYESQVITLVIVSIAIMLMFGALYRSWRMALIGPIPTLVAASMVLGMMGWIGLPLDIMTMTIAAIVIGIGVDDTIHYVDRFQVEVAGGADYPAAAEIAHREIGRAMVYTTMIVTIGFSILTLSNFMPTIYFGLLTGLAMIFALVSNLALLPVLLEKLRPFGARS